MPFGNFEKNLASSMKNENDKKLGELSADERSYYDYVYGLLIGLHKIIKSDPNYTEEAAENVLLGESDVLSDLETYREKYRNLIGMEAVAKIEGLAKRNAQIRVKREKSDPQNPAV